MRVKDLITELQEYEDKDIQIISRISFRHEIVSIEVEEDEESNLIYINIK